MKPFINFYCPVHIYGKPFVEDGVHLVVEDRCEVFLDEKMEKLTEAQQRALQQKRDERANKRLLYLNTKCIESLFGEKGEFQLWCPICGENYTITRQDYDEAYERFLEGDQ